ncbi:calcium-dependent protein kinase 28-like [Folsomia candida]|uniref:calcium-dependent protein kinase 28-like n=1 Tax=Folsomia candida TaxID=158441 RepID=UPI0016050494|nr:calcium-dependent protein kinase 28-like [Folsomia candida]
MGSPMDWTCIQMELCGRSLKHWLHVFQPPMNSFYTQVKQAAIMTDLVEGLKFLHDNKVIHRDLKPDNVMFTTFEYGLPIKIGDFGLARWILPEDGSTFTSSVGTQVYRAPEVSDGKYSYQADLFSFGLIIWELTALIQADKNANLFDKLVNDGNETLVEEHPLLGDKLRKIIISCTKRDPINRFESVYEIAEILVEPMKPAQEIVAQTSEELCLCVQYASPGSTIQLQEVTYSCSIYLRTDNITIVGRGSKTVIDLGHSNSINVESNSCTLSNMKVIFRQKDDTFHRIKLCGSNNRFSDIVAFSAYYYPLPDISYYNQIENQGSCNSIE